MPYITQQERESLQDFEIHLDSARNPGELNYLITTLINQYLGDNPKYRTFNDVLGVLECAKLELYRRRVAPYEDGKIQENGDVYAA